MFNSKSKTSFSETAPGGTTIIGAGTTIAGDMESNGDIRIDGILKGNIMARDKVLVGTDGKVEGNIHGKQADVQGKVTGDIRVSELLLLRGNATINGNIYCGSLQVEPSVTFNGKCHMGANVVEIDKTVAEAVNQ